jgi:hypothetical protein
VLPAPTQAQRKLGELLAPAHVAAGRRSRLSERIASPLLVYLRHRQLRRDPRDWRDRDIGATTRGALAKVPGPGVAPAPSGSQPRKEMRSGGRRRPQHRRESTLRVWASIRPFRRLRGRPRGALGTRAQAPLRSKYSRSATRRGDLERLTRLIDPSGRRDLRGAGLDSGATAACGNDANLHHGGKLRRITIG